MQAIGTTALYFGVAALIGWTMPAAADAGPVLVYIAVSGDTEATEQGWLAGWSNVRLSDAGRRQAEAIAGLLPPTLAAIYTSSLSRAMETAQLASGRFSLITLPDLRPRNVGPFVGTRKDDREFVTRKSRAADNLDGGESLEEYQARLRRATIEIRDSLPAGNVLLVVHRSTATEVLRILAGAAAVETRVPSPGEVAVIDSVKCAPLHAEDP